MNTNSLEQFSEEERFYFILLGAATGVVAPPETVSAPWAKIICERLVTEWSRHFVADWQRELEGGFEGKSAHARLLLIALAQYTNRVYPGRQNQLRAQIASRWVDRLYAAKRATVCIPQEHSL